MTEVIAETRAAALFKTGEPLRIITLGIPRLKPGQALVDLAYSGLCHTQVLEVRGKRGPDAFLPHALGHEGSGMVTQVGEGVTKVRPGDRVVVSWIKGTGADVASTIYSSADGPINSGAVGTFMEQTVTCENRVTPIPDSMPFREAGLLGCAVPTGMGAVLNSAQLKPGNSLAVFGMGGVGLSAVMGGQLALAEPIIAIDIDQEKLALARKLGAAHVVNAREVDPLTAVLDLTGGRGVDCAVEAVGKSETMETAFRSVRNQGGLCVLAGNLPHGGHMKIDPFDLIRGKRIIGTWGGETSPDRDIPRYAELFCSGKLKLDLLVSKEYSLEEINQAIDDLEQGTLGRPLIALGRRA
ncbi:MAG: zinc-binding dehydrogenase [Deltaproteobacteria bacterium]|nr:zinc-binding dehydrogenase [Deltaproteobacteria bacterium]